MTYTSDDFFGPDFHFTVAEMLVFADEGWHVGECPCEVCMDICEDFYDEWEDDSFYDADTLASAGWGTDEDYGYYGE